MTGWQTMCRRNPVLIYYLITFLISWGAVLLVIGGPGHIPEARGRARELITVVVLALLAGPASSALLLSLADRGVAGAQRLLRQFSDWSGGWLRLTLAALFAPLVMLLVLGPMSLASAAYLPGIFAAQEAGPLLGAGIGYGLLAGTLEELGWTGFVTPLLLKRLSPLATGLLIGWLWGAWHFIVNFWGSGDAEGHLDPLVLLPSLTWSLLLLPAFRLLMVWAYSHTGQLIVAALMHFGLTAGMLLLGPLTSRANSAYSLILTAAFMLLAALAGLLDTGMRRWPQERKEAGIRKQM